MHPALARFVPQSASDTMTSFASNFATLARSKLQNACSGGNRDNLSLHRWVLLKNSIYSQDTHSDQAARRDETLSNATESSHRVENDFEDEEVDSTADEGFLFPDPGDSVAAPVDHESVSEEQWLDSLLESLGDDEDNEDSGPMDTDDAGAGRRNDQSRAEAESLCTSFSEDFSTRTPINVPYSVPYPPLNRPFEFKSHGCCLFSDLSPYSRFDHHDIEDSEGSVPDAIEDTSDDESESVSTPFSRSRASLHLVDPASVPLPQDRYEPHIYHDSGFFPYEADPLPYSDYNTESTAAYSPYHEGC